MKGFPLNRLQHLTALLSLTVGSLHSHAQAAQTSPLEIADARETAKYPVTHIAGLSGTTSNLKGDLSLSQTALRFTSAGSHVEIPVSHIEAISIGDERVETGGGAGLILRLAAPPLGAVTQKSIDLLTIEYRDEDGGYHGTVLAASKDVAERLKGQLSARLTTVNETLTPPCQNGATDPTAIAVEPIAVSDTQLPAEYRVLLYEDLVAKLHQEAPSTSFVRAGDRNSGPGCTGMTLKLTVTGFKKGNRAVRSSTGPVGFLTANTSLSVHIDLTDSSEHTLISAGASSNNRIDRESLDTAGMAASAVSKRVVKATSTLRSRKKVS